MCTDEFEMAVKRILAMTRLATRPYFALTTTIHGNRIYLEIIADLLT